jgi:hypothetical protein
VSNAEKGYKANLDMLGFSASFACAVHCAALPVLITVPSALFVGFLANPAVEWTALGLSVVVGLLSLVSSYLRHHRKWNALVLFAAGLAVIWILSSLAPDGYEPIVRPAGALMVALSHLINWRLCTKCRSCS